MENLLTADEFRERLIKTFVNDRAAHYPAKGRDRLVLLGAAAMELRARGTMSSQQLTRVLTTWLDNSGAATALDAVTLRRYLIDIGMLQRDKHGREYEVSHASFESHFEPEVLAIDPLAEIVKASERRHARKEAWLAKQAADHDC